MNSRISEGKDYLRNSFIVFLAVLVCIVQATITHKN